MDKLKFAKYGINPTSITSASQVADINNAIDAEEAKVRKEKQAQENIQRQYSYRAL